MKDKLRTILIYVLAALIIVTLFSASFTVGRYSGEYSSDGTYDGDVDYVVSNQVKISSVEEFFAAIENGYGNIIIADDMDNPLIIYFFNLSIPHFLKFVATFDLILYPKEIIISRL